MSILCRVSILFILLFIGGCGIAATGMSAKAITDAEDLFYTEYAKHIIVLQKNKLDLPIASFADWKNTYIENYAEYGRYYNAFVEYPKMNIGKPMGYNEWFNSIPRPITKMPRTSNESTVGDYRFR
jgi:hypothetical protein